MASKWLEARWEKLIPQLAKYSIVQEQELRRVCEEEIAAWRHHPEYRTLRSLRSPMTQTRHRVRQMAITAENSWVNPKTRIREHVALKYLTFSAEEWKQLGTPSEQSIQRQPLWLRDPDAIVEKGTQLLQGERWSDLLLGIVVNTGRSLSEVVKVGGFHAKTTYSLVFEGRIERWDRPPVTFEVPTFARAEEVLTALARVRRLLAGAAIPTREISVRYRSPVREAAYRHFLRVVPLREGEYDLPRMLMLGVYPCLAVYYYCPEMVDDLTYMATIQGQRSVLEAPSEEERQFLRRVGHYNEYRVADTRKGIRLREEGVEMLSACRWMRRSEQV